MASEATTQAEHQVEGGLLLNVVVRESATVLELLSSEDKALLIGRDALLVLDLGLHVVNSVRRLDLESDGLASQSLDENLHVECFLVVSFLLIIISSLAFYITRNQRSDVKISKAVPI